MDKMKKLCWWCKKIIKKNVDIQTKTMWVSDDEKNTKHSKVILHRSCFDKIN